jgi:predicted DNA-binding transcriptional regulator AlpA
MNHGTVCVSSICCNHKLSGFLRLKDVLKLIPVCKATWWNGCKSGIYPKPYRIGERSTGWKVSDIIDCMNNFSPTIE